ncbi:hypothetical protein AVEN_219009-1 [Araneus ventricosus]|uniref:Uncharacterized protein n=1 Tax=Araneus ventricosus TaxID=182803 RepID=A0A4Y2CBT0_ARAVE|nr:hypothetical protein AVEN_219009-1 [Araneus ventricosus]
MWVWFTVNRPPAGVARKFGKAGASSDAVLVIRKRVKVTRIIFTETANGWKDQCFRKAAAGYIEYLIRTQKSLFMMVAGGYTESLPSIVGWQGHGAFFEKNSWDVDTNRPMQWVY